jgi:hypothetical protein
MRKFATLAAVAALFVLPASIANAVPIEYIFTGTASGNFAGTDFNGAFKVELFADTTNVLVGAPSVVSPTSAIVTIGAQTATLSNTLVAVNTGDAAFPRIIFGQSQPSPVFFVAEGAENAAYASYDLTTAFALTAGTPEFIPQTFLTSIGDLTFRGADSISFEAVISGTPLPGALPLFASGLGAFGLIGWRRKRKAQVAG